jgi:hypothetical protein
MLLGVVACARARAPSAPDADAPAPSSPSSRAASPSWHEANLATLAHRCDRTDVVWAPTAVAFVSCEGGKERAVVNGAPGPAFDHVKDLELAADGTPRYVGIEGGTADPETAIVRGGVSHVVIGDRVGDPLDWALILPDVDQRPPHFAYVARAGFRERLVVDGKPGPKVDSVDTIHVDWLPDGRPAYRAKLDGRTHDVVGDDVGPGYASASVPYVSADGAYAYVEVEDSDAGGRVVVGRTPGPRWDDVDSLVISPEGVVVYEATLGKECWAIVGDRKLGPYDRVLDATFGRGGRLAFRARHGEFWTMVVDGREDPAFAELEPAVFSDDGGHVAYVAHVDDVASGTETVVRDGRRDPAWESVDEGLVWSHDGRHLAYSVERAEGRSVVVDGKVGAPFGDVGPLSFAGDDVVYEARRDSPPGWCVVRGTTPSCFDDVGEPGMIAGYQPFNLTVSGAHLAFRAKRGDRWFIVLDGVEQPPADELWPPVFSAGGRQLGYGARIGDALWWKVAPVSGSASAK